MRILLGILILIICTSCTEDYKQQQFQALLFIYLNNNDIAVCNYSFSCISSDNCKEMPNILHAKIQNFSSTKYYMCDLYAYKVFSNSPVFLDSGRFFSIPWSAVSYVKYKVLN